MHLIFIFAVLCSGAAAMSLIFNKKIEETISLWIFFIIFILYFFGILNLLKGGIYVVIVIGVISLIFCSYNIFSNKKVFIKNILTPGLAVFVILLLIARWGQRGRLLTSWDEFTQWGTVVKNMYIFNALGNHPEATTTFKSYPPGTALIEYFFCKISGSFTEGNLYRAMNILYFSLVIPIFSNLKWKDFSKIIIRFILILILPLAFYQDFYTIITVDAILGVVFASILINYYVNEISAFKIIYISLALFTLTIIKASGFGLGIICLMIISIDALFIKRKEIISYMNKIGHGSVTILILMCPLIFTLISKYSWSIYLKVTKTLETRDIGQINFHNVKDIFSGVAPEYQITTFKKFVTYLTQHFLTDYTIKITYIGWISLLIVISIIFVDFVCSEEEKGRYKVTVITIFIGCAIYDMSLMILYALTFSVSEATSLASCSRYMSTYTLGILIFLVSIVCLKEQTGHTKLKTSFSLCILLLLLLIVNITPIADITILARSNIKTTIKSRKFYTDIIKIKHVLNPKVDRVYIISGGSNGHYYWGLRYDITPIRTNTTASWSIGKPYYKGDVYTQDISLKQWEDNLKRQYNYVYIFRHNNSFNRIYGKAFEGGYKSIENYTLYHREIKDGKVILKKVNQIIDFY